IFLKLSHRQNTIRGYKTGSDISGAARKHIIKRNVNSLRLCCFVSGRCHSSSSSCFFCRLCSCSTVSPCDKTYQYVPTRTGAKILNIGTLGCFVSGRCHSSSSCFS
ncbi:unnamed protein product, partial [Laminaria digitata]